MARKKKVPAVLTLDPEAFEQALEDLATKPVKTPAEKTFITNKLNAPMNIAGIKIAPLGSIELTKELAQNSLFMRKVAHGIIIGVLK